MQEKTDRRVAEFWNGKVESPKIQDRFWFSPGITGHINRKICGKALTGVASGLHEKLANLASAQPFSKAISVGCGVASKELNLLTRGIVDHFDLFELASERLDKARANYAAKGISHRSAFYCEDAFEGRRLAQYDLVYWNSSLHHMPDVHSAIQWSWDILKPGGVLAIFEFIGPTRFQWSDRNLEYVRRFREIVPERLLKRRGVKDLWIRRPTVEEMLARDPSEAADSSNITPAIRSTFSDSEIINIGGALYHFGLNGIYPNLQPGDEWVIDCGLAIDDLLQELGEVHFAVCIGKKNV